MIYLDNAASTAVHPQVFEKMQSFFTQHYGNPSSIHKLGRTSRKVVTQARQNVAKMINCETDEIYFTSGGTESNNTVLGIIQQQQKRHIITSSIEHESVLEPCKKLASLGFDITYLKVDKYGMVDPKNLLDYIRDDTCLVSIMYANNEVGTIQKINEIGKICNDSKILFHTDATQAVGKVRIDVKTSCIDFLSMSSHKIHGPKGIGALYIQKNIKSKPFILGGGQEFGLRSGTENVPGIVGFGAACEISFNNFDENVSKMKQTRDRLVDLIIQQLDYVEYNGHKDSRLPNNAHFTFLGVNGEDLIIKLDESDIYASTGSACSLIYKQKSHVLEAMNLSHEQILGSLRLTVSPITTIDEIEIAVDKLVSIVKKLRSVSPYLAKYNFKI